MLAAWACARRQSDDGEDEGLMQLFGYVYTFWVVSII